jgi:hypothetical protein
MVTVAMMSASERFMMSSFGRLGDAHSLGNCGARRQTPEFRGKRSRRRDPHPQGLFTDTQSERS